MIAEGYDVGIRAGEMRDSTMVARAIAPLHFVICGAPSYLAKYGIPRKPADLAGHNCVRLQNRRTRAGPANWVIGQNKEDRTVNGNLLRTTSRPWCWLPCMDRAWRRGGAPAGPAAVPIECLRATFAGLHIEPRTLVHPLPQPKALAGAHAQLRQLHARPVPEESGPGVGSENAGRTLSTRVIGAPLKPSAPRLAGM